MNTYEYQLASGDFTSPAYQVQTTGGLTEARTLALSAWPPGSVEIKDRMHVVAVTPARRLTLDGQPDENFTVEEASRYLSCWQPVPVGLLGKLGKDCSMVAHIRDIAWTERAVNRPWGKERAYPFDIIREVFELNPDTAPYIPKEIS